MNISMRSCFDISHSLNNCIGSLKKAINTKNVKIYFMPNLISGRDGASIQYTKKAKKQ